MVAEPPGWWAGGVIKKRNTQPRAKVDTMESTMQERPFSVSQILTYGTNAHRNSTVTTYLGTEPEVTTFEEIGARVAALAHALAEDFGIRIGDRVATLMVNRTEHLEVLLAAPSMGAVFQPLNRQLADDQVIHTINHAENRVIVCDAVDADRLVEMLPQCPTVEGVILVGASPADFTRIQDRITLTFAEADPDRRIHVADYEPLLDERPAIYDWPDLPETAPAALCYSTGTAGAPKGVVYSHRSLWLHSLGLRTADSFGIQNDTPFLLGVPIYHVLSWGVPLAAFMSGAPMVMTGHTTDPEHLAHVIEDAMPRQAHGASAVWMSLIVHYEKTPPRRMSLQTIYSGGSQVPPALIDAWEARYGVDMIHCWGMTETSPIGTVAHPPAGVAGQARAAYRYSQGRFPVGLEYRIVNDAGRALESHDRNAGELQVRGNTVAASYYESPSQTGDGAASVFRGEAVDDGSSRFTVDGWLRTGDIATVTQDGFLVIHYRKNDVIRSGGEWIYSASLENYLLAHPGVNEAAVIGIPDDKWGQRPLAIVVLAAGYEPTEETATDIRNSLLPQVPAWMAPENFSFVANIERTSVEKFDKKELRRLMRRGELDFMTLPDPDEEAEFGQD